MAESCIPVDLLNPGQVFACLGLLEAADILLGAATAAFDWNNGRETTFRLATAGDEAPVARVLRFLEETRIVTRVPANSASSAKWVTGWGDEPERDRFGRPFPFPDPGKPDRLPVVLRDEAGNEITIDYWGDKTVKTRRDDVKFWAGAGGYPGAARLRDAVQLARGKMRQYRHHPFNLPAEQSSSLGFDWRRDYVPVQDGFSPNKQKNGGPMPIVMIGFPLVEILAAIGMTNARPSRSRKTKLEYRYGVLAAGGGPLLDPMFHRAALGAATSPVPGRPFRRFVMQLDWPGQEDQARCITQVTEEE